MSAPLSPLESPTKIPFKNLDSAEVPAFAVMQVTGSVVEDGVTFLTCAQVGTTLLSELAVNGHSRVRSGEKGVCYRQGDVQVAFDGGSPQAGEGWGVRANQWTLSRGYPSIVTVHAVENAANRILHGELTPLTGVLGVANADLAPMVSGEPGSGSVAVYVWDGTTFTPASPVMHFTGHNISTTRIKAGELTQFVESDGIWIVDTTAISLVRFELTADLEYGTNPSGANATMLVWDADHYAPTGEEITVYDWTEDGAYGTWSGKSPATGISGYQGFAILKPDSNRYEIVWMETRARFIAFTLSDELLKTDASKAFCPVTAYWEGRNPDPGSAGVTVYNLASAITGNGIYSGQSHAAGYAVLDESFDIYKIVYVESSSAADVVEGIVYAAFTKTTSQFLAVVTRSYQNRYAPGQTIIVQNYFKPNTGKYLFEGEAGAACLVNEDPTSGLDRADWVECPQRSPVQVSDPPYVPGGGSPLVAPSSPYSFGGI